MKKSEMNVKIDPVQSTSSLKNEVEMRSLKHKGLCKYTVARLLCYTLTKREGMEGEHKESKSSTQSIPPLST